MRRPQPPHLTCRHRCCHWCVGQRHRGGRGTQDRHVMTRGEIVIFICGSHMSDWWNC
jgi:hypothetical protein